ncbi:YdbL family protein [Pelagicoccus sp. SDUM812003]|uniref:YdbL family protein n=1 Tax=Pelagicoccus sp. SDUM812003 TaxID=3041267 RepID=UPI0028104D56|nr:YdbL family protein [Pelagicoccus sp. SDUM812003]MDQ8202828.1 YdbL family protein [Pelagicoccus sp. SDUM812003]
MNTVRFPLFLALIALLFSTAPLSAQSDDEEAIKQRILQRVDQIDALKTKGLVGENKNGLLEQRAMLTPEQTKLMNEENADRRALYTIVAQKLGLTTAVVGQGRAAELRKKSADGVWLQAEDGAWYKKGTR